MSNFIYSIPLILLLSGCLASQNPPIVPAKDVVQNIPYLWPEIKEEPSATTHNNESFGQDTNLGIDNGIIAIVNKRIITLKRFDYRFMSALKTKPWDMDGRDLYLQVLNALVDRLLLLELAVQKEIEIKDSEVENALEEYVKKFEGGWEGYRRMLESEKMSLSDIREQIREDLMLKRVTPEIYRGLGAPSPQMIEKVYKQRISNYISQEKRDISLILLLKSSYQNNDDKARDAMQKVLEQLKHKPFAEVAKRLSDGAKARQGGRQGYIKREDLAEDITNVAFKLKKGETSSIGTMKGAYFIIQCHDIQEATTKPFSEVQTKIQNELFYKMRNKRKAKVLANIRNSSYIRKLSPENYLKYRKSIQ